jgi:uroporphyrinogen III methyltransferase/synthase
MKNKIKGCVYLVGAGPGDPGLVTVRGRELIQQADVIVYDYLVSPRLLQLARAEAELIYVGKQAARHSLPQEQINQLLIDKAREKQTIVRLKGGDPYVFGRGGEEALELVEAGIAFEVVPGVTAGVAACAYAGIPVTHRDFASDFALITGHEDAGRTGPSQIDWASLGCWKGTLVFYMGVKNLPVICGKLQEHGMSAEMPAALIRYGTTAQQRTLVGTVSTLSDLAVKHNITPPAVIVIGKVVSLREKLKWFEGRPLFGKRIVVTRSRDQASELVDRLNRLGGEVLEFPTIRIEPPLDIQPIQNAIKQLQKYNWIIFTSVNGVESFFEQLHTANRDARCFSSAKVCAIGPATAGRLQKFGITADLIPPRFVAESIVETLSEIDDLAGKRILLARGDIARAGLPQSLKKLGAAVDEIIAYRTIADDSSTDGITDAIKQDSIDWITFTSSSTVRNFFKRIDAKLLSGKKLRLASIGPITSDTIKEVGLSVDVEAEEYTIIGLVNAVCEEVTK